MTVYVLVSDVGLNGYVIHGVFADRPSNAFIDAVIMEVSLTTGYQHTVVEEHEIEETS